MYSFPGGSFSGSLLVVWLGLRLVFHSDLLQRRLECFTRKITCMDIAVAIESEGNSTEFNDWRATIATVLSWKIMLMSELQRNPSISLNGSEILRTSRDI